MLAAIRNRSKGWLAYLIIGLITVPFALFGISEYFIGGADIIVADIDGEEITKAEFLQEFNPKKRRLQEQIKDKYTNKADFELKRSVIGGLINRRLLDQLAEKLNYTATTAELQAIIQADSVFKNEDGSFSMEKYTRLLRINGYNPKQYEALKLKELSQNQVRYNLLKSAFVTPSQLNRLHLLNNQERQFSTIKMTADKHLNAAAITPQQVKDFYQDKKTDFIEPQKIKVEYLELSLAGLSKKIEVSTTALQDFYEEEKARFSSEEERKAEHILLENETDAKKVVAELASGGDFNALAKQHSKDTGSKINGGDLGFFTKGVMVPPFEKQVFAMQVGEVSPPIKSDFGYHIIRLNEVKLAAIKSFDAVKDELEDIYREAEAKKLLYESVDEMANLVYESSLEIAGRKMNILPVKVSKFFARNDSELSPLFVTTGFSDTVLKRDENSKVIDLGNDKFVAMKLLKSNPERQKPFDEVKAEIKQILTFAGAQLFIEKTVKKIARALSKDDDSNKKIAADLIKKHQLKWGEQKTVKRNSTAEDARLINKVFSRKKPSGDKPTYGFLNLVKEGESFVIKLSEVKFPDSKPDDATKALLIKPVADEMFIGILKTLRQDAEVKIFSDRL